MAATANTEASTTSEKLNTRSPMFMSMEKADRVGGVMSGKYAEIGKEFVFTIAKIG